MSDEDNKSALKLTFSGVKVDLKPSDHYFDADWQTLQFSVLWAFEAIASADKKVDEKERAAFTDALAKAPSDKLTGHVFAAVRDNLAALSEARTADKRDPLRGLSDVEALLRRYPSRDEAKAFRQALIDMATRIAEASGGGLFGLGSKVSDEEAGAIGKICRIFGLPVPR